MAKHPSGRALRATSTSQIRDGSTLSRWQSNWQSDDTKCYRPTKRGARSRHVFLVHDSTGLTLSKANVVELHGCR